MVGKQSDDLLILQHPIAVNWSSHKTSTLSTPGKKLDAVEGFGFEIHQASLSQSRELSAPQV